MTISAIVEEARERGMIWYDGVPDMGRLGGPVVMRTWFRDGMRFSDRLSPRLDLRNHSPTGLSWGYMGSGPHQCALALLADALEDDERALKLYNVFCREVVSRFNSDGRFKLSREAVREYADRLEQAEETTT